jgi:uncharacterized membrane protein
MKKVSIAIILTALIITVAFITLKAYVVLPAVLLGVLLIGYRELWSLVRTGKMPPFDERVRDNTNSSVRNALVFFTAIAVLLMLIFSLNWAWRPTLLSLLAGLFVAVSAVYFLSYLFYDRIEPYLDEKGQRWLRNFLIIAATSIGVFILSFVLHNAVDAVLKYEEGVFFTIAVIIAPLGLAVGLLGSLGICITKLITQKR